MSMDNNGGITSTWAKLLIRPPELYDHHTSSHQVAKQEELEK
jgi:hypothetical protein